MEIQQFTMEDCQAVEILWRLCGIEIGDTLSCERLRNKMEVDPDLFLVATENKAILGAAVGSWDCMRGWICTVGVDPVFRRMGVGTRLVSELEKRLVNRGAKEILALVPRNDLLAEDLMLVNGFAVDEHQYLMKKQVTALSPRKPPRTRKTTAGQRKARAS